MSSFLKLLRKGHKHEKLMEEWDSNQETVLEGLTFYVKYLGSCLVENPSGEHVTAEAIKSIVAMARASGKKLERVSFTVSPNTIKCVNAFTHDVTLEVPIHRISYCSADAHFDHVFAFIRSNKNDIMECHAFLCAKKKMAQAVTLTISQAFNVAYELWESKKREKSENRPTDEITTSSTTTMKSSCDIKEDSLQGESSTQDQLTLIDLHYEGDRRPFPPNSSGSNQNQLDDFRWKNHFAQFSHSPTHVPFETNLVSENVSDAFISQFLVVKSLAADQSKEFFQDDATDLMLL